MKAKAMTTEELRERIIALATEKGWDVRDAADHARRTSLARNASSGKEAHHWNR